MTWDLAAFSGSVASIPITNVIACLPFSVEGADLPVLFTCTLKSRQPSLCDLFFSVSLRSHTQYKNINLFLIDYAFQFRLRGRLTLLRLTLNRNFCSSGERAFYPLIVTYSAFALLIFLAAVTRLQKNLLLNRRILKNFSPVRLLPTQRECGLQVPARRRVKGFK